jgi:hypothetical protein
VRFKSCLAFAALILTLEGRRCSADPIVDAVYSLGPPNVSGSKVTFAVNLTFTATDGLELAFFGIDVSPSSSALTANGTNFSAFKFIPSVPPLGGWTLVQDFNTPGPFLGTAEFEAGSTVPPGTYTLGTLELDLSKVASSPPGTSRVAITGSNTTVGLENPSDPLSFDFFDVSFLRGAESQPISPSEPQPPIGGGGGNIPEPASLVVFAVAGGLLLLKRRRAAAV